MFDHPFKALPSKIESVKTGMAALQFGQQAQGLGIMVKPPMINHAILQHIFTRMAKRRMAKIMG